MTIEVETGPMFCGKTRALVARIKNHRIAEDKFGEDFLTFNHAIDVRYGEGMVGSHDGEREPAIGVFEAEDILRYVGEEDEKEGVRLKEKYQGLRTIFIDEGQFFEGDLAMVVQYLDETLGIDVVVAGLDTNFKGEPFGPMLWQ